DYYYLGSITGGTDALLSNPLYPGAPMTNQALTVFDASQYTGGDLNGLLGSAGDNYGASVTAWLTPTVTRNYVFFLASDDQSELQLSTDANPATAQMIAVESGCCHGFQETNSGFETVSAPQALVAGVSYFIRAFYVEAGGGDYVKVA